MSVDAATQRQNQAAEPGASVWLSANAGSGKTRVLTDRVARLLLDKVKPQNILCLTYTKAAASEMQNRLFRRLGDWAMKRDSDLSQELAALGVEDVTNPERLAETRRLFARAIETPGGLRIQTIHSFCASLLRRFPLEAGVTPNFTEMDDRTAVLLRGEILEDLADGENVDVIDAVAAFFSGDDLDRLAAAVVNEREALSRGASRDEIFGWFGLPADFGADMIYQDTFLGSEASLFAALDSALRNSDKVTDQRAAEKLVGLDFTDPGHVELECLIGLLLTGSSAKEPFSAKIGKFPNKDCRAALGDWCGPLDDLMIRVEQARNLQNRLYSAEKTVALYRFADAFLPAFAARKQAMGWLDFDDLILKSRELLSNDAVAAWVLYRLDGGLDHILVDEAQDTSPAQWQVIERLAQEFTAGLGARDAVRRTIFVVGDKKQSIYSFQGADPREFDRMQAHFSDRLRPIGVALLSMELEYSFRSSDAVLRFVDQAVVASDMAHRAFRDALPGRVDLWPAVPVTPKPERQHWYDPIDIKTEDHQTVVLARKLADHIADLIQNETIPAENGSRRRIKAGDFLILVRRRSDLFEEIIRACKAKGLPVAGADRLKLGAELAVRDLAAVLAFLATPEDDLSLAAALKSPILGWEEADLYDLAAGRTEAYLWPALRNRADEFHETVSILRDLRNNADFLRPYDLIERILTRHDGRRKLLARLGPEAEDGIDALLAQSLAYERIEIPSLTGFLTWLETDDVEVKRQMDSAGDLIRVMTVHGAKGLESPIVILPDTAKRVQPVRAELVPLEDGQMIWRTAADQQPEVVQAAMARMKAAQTAEDERLFYVAVTRAESWLIVAAAGETGTDNDSWHSTAEAGLRALGSVPLDTPTGAGLRYAHMDWTAGPLVERSMPAPPVQVMPDWAGAPVNPPDRPVAPLSPSDLGGAKAIWADGDFDEQAALRHGRMVHLLLEVLPDLPEADWRDAAKRLLENGQDFVHSEDSLDQVFQEVQQVLTAADLAFLFDPSVLSEVDISAGLQDLGDRRVSGTVDKLIVRPDSVLAVDFKTNVLVPATEAEVPEGVLRQMGAYQAVLGSIYPDRRIDTAILWTKTAQLMPLPQDMVRDALHRAATS